MTDKESVLVVVPAYNESGSIAGVVRELTRGSFRVLVIDDGSTDGTAKLAAQAGANVLILPFNLGVGGALRVGFLYAVRNNYRAVIQVDADGQHPVDSVEFLIQQANLFGADLVLGSRFRSQETTLRVSWIRKVAMVAMARMATSACGTRITDATSGFRIIRTPLLEEFARTFPAHYLGDTFEALVMAGRSGFKVVEVPAALRERQVGISSASSLKAFSLTLRAFIVALLRL